MNQNQVTSTLICNNNNFTIVETYCDATRTTPTNVTTPSDDMSDEQIRRQTEKRMEIMRANRDALMPLAAQTNEAIRIVNDLTHYSSCWNVRFDFQRFAKNKEASDAIVQAYLDWNMYPRHEQHMESDSTTETIARKVVRTMMMNKNNLHDTEAGARMGSEIKARVVERTFFLPCHPDALVHGPDLEIDLRQAMKWFGAEERGGGNVNVIEFVMLDKYYKHGVMLEEKRKTTTTTNDDDDDVATRTVRKVVVDNISMGYIVPYHTTAARKNQVYVFVQVFDIDHWFLEATGFVIHLPPTEVLRHLDKQNFLHDVQIKYNQDERGRLDVDTRNTS